MIFTQWPTFLSPALLSEVQQVASSHRDDFIVSGVLPHRKNFRRSTLLLPRYYLHLHDQFIHYLLPCVAQVLRELKMDMSECKIDLQMTRHGNGDYFRRHVDAGFDETNDRKISFVNYFRLTEEKMFHGGELKLYEDWGRWCGVKLFNPMGKVIQPSHNSIVFFPSENITHEVKPVICSEYWEDGRFSMNGWISKT